jgi:hypothetical protein
MIRRVVYLMMVSITMVLLCSLASAEYGGVVRIHFSNSIDPGLSEIVDTYYGAGIVRAHLVIDSMPGGQVSAFHLGFDIESEDSSVVVIGKFHPRPGWKVLNPDDDLPGVGEIRGAVTPVSVGYWNLWLRNQAASSGALVLKPLQRAGSDAVFLVDQHSEQTAALRLYHGGVNRSAPPAIDLLQVAPPGASDWSDLPNLYPVWVLKVEGNTGYVTLNEFNQGGRLADSGLVFPLNRVPVRDSESHRDEHGFLTTHHLLSFLDIDASGIPVTSYIEWPDPIDQLTARDLVGRSIHEKTGMHSTQGASQIRGPDGTMISELPLEIVFARFYDIPEVILAKARQEVLSGGETIDLWKLLVLDYDGRIRYESEWTECEYQDAQVQLRDDIVWFTLRRCFREGEYVLDLGREWVQRLPDLPMGLRAYSPHAQSVLVRSKHRVRFYDITNPEAPIELWSRRFDERVLDVAISEERAFVCVGLGQRTPTYEFIPVLGAQDGRPLAKLIPADGTVLEGPFVFVGDFLLTSIDLALSGRPLETRFICVFDLAELRGRD